VNWTNAGIYQLVSSNRFGETPGPLLVNTVLRDRLRFDAARSKFLQGNQGFELRILGASGAGPVILESSADFLQWDPIFTNPPTLAAIDYTDYRVTNGIPHGFYSAREAISTPPIELQLVPGDGRNKGRFVLKVAGLSTLGNVVVLASTNLVEWDPVHTNPPTTGPLFYLDPESGTAGSRFYRVSEQR
jgi:hypothetical protein